MYITTHGKYEIEQMVKKDKQHVKEYALDALRGSIVREDAIFGFHSDLFPEEHQRSKGFGSGRFIDRSEQLLRDEFRDRYGTDVKRKETQILFNQEADIELAWRSKDYPVITFDAKKRGPLRDALDQGFKVVSLDLKRSTEVSSDDFMQEIVSKIKTLET